MNVVFAICASQIVSPGWNINTFILHSHLLLIRIPMIIIIIIIIIMMIMMTKSTLTNRLVIQRVWVRKRFETYWMKAINWLNQVPVLKQLELIILFEYVWFKKSKIRVCKEIQLPAPICSISTHSISAH